MRRIVFLECSYRSSHRRCSVRKDVLRNFEKFTGKHLCQSLFFNKVVGLRPATLLKKRLWHRCFPVNFAKFLRTPFLQNTSGWLLLFLDPCCPNLKLCLNLILNLILSGHVHYHTILLVKNVPNIQLLQYNLNFQTWKNIRMILV